MTTNEAKQPMPWRRVGNVQSPVCVCAMKSKGLFLWTQTIYSIYRESTKHKPQSNYSPTSKAKRRNHPGLPAEDDSADKRIDKRLEHTDYRAEAEKRRNSSYHFQGRSSTGKGRRRR